MPVGSMPKRSTIRGRIRPSWNVALICGAVFLYIVYREWVGMFHLHYIAYDYAFFYYAFQSVLHHQVSFHAMYNLSRQMTWLHQVHYPINPHNQYVYPPQFAVLFVFLGRLPFSVSAALWMLGSALSYFGGLWCLLKLLWPGARRIHLLALMVAGLMMTPFEIDVIAGNVNSLLFFAICLACYLFYGRHRPRLAGIPLGLAILFKVTPAAVLLVFVLRRQWRVCTWTLLTVLAGTGITASVVGIGPVVQYAMHFLALGQNSMKNGPAPYNQSIVGVVGMLQQHGWMFNGKWLQDMAYLVFVMWVLRSIWVTVRTHSADWRLDMAVASLCPLLFSPLIEEMHLLYAVPAVMLLVRLAYEGTVSVAGKHVETKRLWVIAGLCAFLLTLPVTYALNFVTAHWPFLAWLHVQMFVVLMSAWCAVLWRYRRMSKLNVAHPAPIGGEHRNGQTNRFTG